MQHFGRVSKEAFNRKRQILIYAEVAAKNLLKLSPLVTSVGTIGPVLCFPKKSCGACAYASIGFGPICNSSRKRRFSETLTCHG
jgi:hypothetical protein